MPPRSEKCDARLTKGILLAAVFSFQGAFGVYSLIMTQQSGQICPKDGCIIIATNRRWQSGMSAISSLVVVFLKG